MRTQLADTVCARFNSQAANFRYMSERIYEYVPGSGI